MPAGRRGWLPIVLALATLSAAPAAIADDPVARIAGADRYATAAAAAREAAMPGADRTVVVARGDAFPDALAAAALAGSQDTVVVLTRPGGLPAATRDAIADLDVARAIVVGGEAAVAPAVVDELAALGADVTRIAGADRYATAAAVALERDIVGVVDGLPTALLASGRSFPDALVAGPLAWRRSLPILLTEPDELHPAAAAAIRGLEVEQVLVIGGERVVGPAVLAGLDGLNVRRLAGPDRGGTAAAVASYALESAEFDFAHAVLARGDDFADALAGAPLAGRLTAPLLLARGPTELGASTRAYLEEGARELTGVTALGGGRALAEPVLDEVRGILADGVVEGTPAVAYFHAGATHVAEADGATLRRFLPSDEFSLDGGRVALVRPRVVAGSLPPGAAGTPDLPTSVFDVATGREEARVLHARLPILAGERLLFFPDADGIRDETMDTLWVREPDGAERVVVDFPNGPEHTGHPDAGIYLSVGVDGTGERLVFAHGNDLTLFFYDVWTADVASGTLTRLTSDARSRFPAISPDGERVAYLREGESCTGEDHGPFATELMLVPAAGGDATVAKPGSCQQFWGRPAWVSDGALVLARVRADDGSFTADLVHLDVSSGAETLLAEEVVADASVSAVTGHVAYQTAAADGGFVLLDLATGAETPFAQGLLPKVAGDRRW